MRAEGRGQGAGKWVEHGWVPSQTEWWESLVQDKGRRFRRTLFEGGIIRTDVMEAERLGKWDGVLAGSGV